VDVPHFVILLRCCDGVVSSKIKPVALPHVHDGMQFEVEESRRIGWAGLLLRPNRGPDRVQRPRLDSNRLGRDCC
jgi:hypothetical protein